MMERTPYIMILFILIPIVSVSQIAVPTPSCDINADGIVDRDDLYILVQNWQLLGASYTPTPIQALTPSPFPTRPRVPPAPENITLKGEQVEGAYPDTFYNQVTISWDPIPNFDVQDASKYYQIDVFYIEAHIENFYYFSKRIDEATSVILDMNDIEFEPLGFTPTGYLFVLYGVEVKQSGIHFTSEGSRPRFFNLIRRPTPTPTPTAILTPTP